MAAQIARGRRTQAPRREPAERLVDRRFVGDALGIAAKTISNRLSDGSWPPELRPACYICGRPRWRESDVLKAVREGITILPRPMRPPDDQQAASSAETTEPTR